MSNEKQQGFLLSVLIPTIPQRAASLAKLHDHIGVQMIILLGLTDKLCEIITDDSLDYSIGVKRNKMLQRARGKYVAFVDDDDRISDNYLMLLLPGMLQDFDCCSLKGVITENGGPGKCFLHSIQYDSMYEKDNIYYRPINHLNCIKREIALQVGYPDVHRGEDSHYCLRLMGSRLLKTEYHVHDTLYYYDYISNKPTFYR